MVDTVRLYRITITGWIAQDNLGGNFENFTPNCGDFETMVSMMVGVNVEEKLVDTIPFPGELDSSPSAPNNSMRWGSYAVDGLDRTPLQDQLQQFTDCMIDPDGNHACERNGHECKCTCTECYPAWIRCMDHLIEELVQPDGKDLPVGQRFEYGDVNTCWTCQDKGEKSN